MVGTFAQVSQVGALSLADGFETLEGLSLIFESEQRLDRASAEGVGEHLRSVTQHKKRAVGESGRQVAQLHPALRPPAQKFHFLRCEMFGSDDRCSPVVLFDAFIDDEIALSKIL